MATMLRVKVREASRSSGPALRVDREAGIIYGVKVLGRKSRNRREYTDAAFDSAVAVMEGAMVNIDHSLPGGPESKGGRKVSSRFGKLVNLRKEADGVYADLHYLKSHAMAEQVCEAAERMPDVLGLSQDATVAGERRPDGVLVVHEVVAVRSVDVVADPGSVNSLFESDGEDYMEPIMQPDVAQAAPAAMGVEEAFLCLQNALMASADHDDAERLAALKDVMKLKAKIMGTEAEEAEGDDEEAEESAPRGGAPKGTRKRLRFLEIKDKVRDAGLVPEQDLLESLMDLSDERVDGHIAYLARKQSGKRVRSAARPGPHEARTALRAQESAPRAGTVPAGRKGPPPLDDIEALAAWCSD